MFNNKLNEREKGIIVNIIKESGYDIETFHWENRRNFLRIRSILIHKPYGYYFIFGKDKNNIKDYQYFPNWSIPNSKDDQTSNKNIEFEIIHWLNSIRRTIKRHKQIVRTIDEGVIERKKFEYFARKININSKKN